MSDKVLTPEDVAGIEKRLYAANGPAKTLHGRLSRDNMLADDYRADIPLLLAEITRLRGLIEGMGHEPKCETLQLRHYPGPCDCIQSKVNL